ncbi:hypothetical protein C8R42DRAFT_658425 [Lentinula raphanica]|nr:hypothetical protein C8R42DRAFT_658425 [Lentinula raphanica]
MSTTTKSVSLIDAVPPPNYQFAIEGSRSRKFAPPNPRFVTSRRLYHDNNDWHVCVNYEDG